MGRAKYPLELRMAVVKHYLPSQDGTKRTANAFGVHKSEVSQWVAACQKHGIDGITWKNGRYSFEFRLHVVRVVQSEFLSLREAAVRFNISEHKVVGRWVKAYETSGDEGLRNLRKWAKISVKKASKKPTPPPGSSSKPAEELSHEELLAELRYLRAEVDYLKKLKALAQKGTKPE